MGILRFNYRSQALEGYVDITLTYPTDNLSYYDMRKERRHHSFPGAPALPMYERGMKFQTIYLIHGGGDDDSLTYRYLNSEFYAQQHNVMLVTPRMVNSFGIDTQFHVNYGTFLTEELPVVIQTLFASSPKREDNFIMGYAMGGNVALGTAIRRPDLYAACVDISGGIGMTVNTETLKGELAQVEFPLYAASFPAPETIDGSGFDLYATGRAQLASGAPQPKFWILSGQLEFVRSRIKADAETMKQMGYDVDYLEFEGRNHDFPFWDFAVKYAMDQLLPLKNSPIYPEKL